MIRPATMTDLNAIIGIASFEALRYEKLHADADKIRRLIIMAISSAKHFCWVSENENDIKGVIVGVTSRNLWAQRQNCLVTLWTSEIVGDGVKMMRKFIEWVKSRRIIRVAGIVPDNNEIDPRVWSLVERIGFEKQGGTYLLYN